MYLPPYPTQEEYDKAIKQSREYEKNNPLPLGMSCFLTVKDWEEYHKKLDQKENK